MSGVVLGISARWDDVTLTAHQMAEKVGRKLFPRRYEYQGRHRVHA